MSSFPSLINSHNGLKLWRRSCEDAGKGKKLGSPWPSAPRRSTYAKPFPLKSLFQNLPPSLTTCFQVTLKKKYALNTRCRGERSAAGSTACPPPAGPRPPCPRNRRCITSISYIFIRPNAPVISALSHHERRHGGMATVLKSGFRLFSSASKG